MLNIETKLLRRWRYAQISKILTNRLKYQHFECFTQVFLFTKKIYFYFYKMVFKNPINSIKRSRLNTILFVVHTVFIPLESTPCGKKVHPCFKIVIYLWLSCVKKRSLILVCSIEKDRLKWDYASLTSTMHIATTSSDRFKLILVAPSKCTEKYDDKRARSYIIKRQLRRSLFQKSFFQIFLQNQSP